MTHLLLYRLARSDEQHKDNAEAMPFIPTSSCGARWLPPVLGRARTIETPYQRRPTMNRIVIALVFLLFACDVPQTTEDTSGDAATQMTTQAQSNPPGGSLWCGYQQDICNRGCGTFCALPGWDTYCYVCRAQCQTEYAQCLVSEAPGGPRL
jgi:hypothetical protein